MDFDGHGNPTVHAVCWPGRGTGSFGIWARSAIGDRAARRRKDR